MSNGRKVETAAASVLISTSDIASIVPYRKRQLIISLLGSRWMNDEPGMVKLVDLVNKSTCDIEAPYLWEAGLKVVASG